MSNQHFLKIHPAPLADLLSGAKTAEVRCNDRGFQVGDTVRLMEVNPETLNWTGRPDLVRTISHIQTGYGLPDGMCVLSYAQPFVPRNRLPGRLAIRAALPDVPGDMLDHGLFAALDAMGAQAEQQEAQGAQAGEFQREDRYIVIKRKDLQALHRDAFGPTQVAIEAFYAGLRMIEVQLPRRDFLVIESDWPEYEPTWAAIQARVTGQGAQAGEFWTWLDLAYRDGSKGEGRSFTKYNMEVAYRAGTEAARAALATQPDAGTTSDQYRAELYDEVWQNARSMGYGNVTDALSELERFKLAQAAAGKPAAVVEQTDYPYPVSSQIDVPLPVGTQLYTVQPAAVRGAEHE